MHKHSAVAFTFLVAAVLAACAVADVQPVYTADGKPVAPVAEVRPHAVASPHGTRDDPYYWLRDDSRKDPEVLAHLRAERAYADAVLAPTRALQESLFKEIVGHIKEDDATVPVLEHGWWYYKRFETGKEYPIHVRRRAGLPGAAEEILVDGNVLAQGKAYSSIGELEVSPDSRYLAYSEDPVGRYTYTIRFRDLATGKDLPDTITGAEPDIEWANDNKTVLWIEKDPVTLLGYRVRRHELGTDAVKDPLVYEEADRSYYVSLERSKSDEYLFINLASTLQTEVRYADADDPALAFRTFLPREPKHEYQVEFAGTNFVVRSNWQAQNFRIMKVAPDKTADKSAWQEVVPHRERAFVEDFEVYENWLALNERSGGLLKLRVQPWSASRGTPRLIEAGEPSYSMTLVGTPDLARQKVRYVYTSLATPKTTYEYDLKTGRRELLKRDEVPGGFDPGNYVTEFLEAPAPDGTRVPVSLVRRRDVRRDGSAPLLQYGYGSYGYSTDPTFNPVRLSLLDRGFVFAIAHVRGGQELGRRWYEDGKLLNKRNTFTDFIAVTEHLVGKGYAAADKVFAIGGSAGGLLMGAIANLRPDLYRGIVAQVPFVDVVTTMLDESIPLTTNEYDEWGDPRRKEYYDYMLGYSPYDQVAPRAYPAMLVEAGLWDSQVQYFEPAKWVAKLRAAQTADRPILFKVNLDAGHGGKSGRYEAYRERATEYAFMLQELGIEH